MSTKSLGVVIIAPEITDYYYKYKYLVDGFLWSYLGLQPLSESFLALTLDNLNPSVYCSKPRPRFYAAYSGTKTPKY